VIAALALLVGFMLVYMALHLHRARQGISNLRR